MTNCNCKWKLKIGIDYIHGHCECDVPLVVDKVKEGPQSLHIHSPIPSCVTVASFVWLCIDSCD